MKEVKKNNNNSGNSIEISNLAKEIQVDELLVLFSQFGEIGTLSIKWDKNKPKKCAAVIEYGSRAEASKAKDEYNGAELDSNLMKIRIL